MVSKCHSNKWRRIIKKRIERKQHLFYNETSSKDKTIVKKRVSMENVKQYKKLELVFQAMFLKKGIFAALSLSIEAGQKFRTLSTEYIRLYDGAKQLLQFKCEKPIHLGVG